MKNKIFFIGAIAIIASVPIYSQIGTRFPSEKKEIIDPVTGVKLTFLTSTPAGDSKIYQTHNQWTSDGQWLIFRSRRVRGEAMAVHEETGVIVQVSEGGYRGMLNVARKSMKLFFMRPPKGSMPPPNFDFSKKDSVKREEMIRYFQQDHAMDVIEVDLATLFADSKSGSLGPESKYQRVCGTIPEEYGARGDMALDAEEEWVWFPVGKKMAMEHLPEGAKIEENYGPRNMGAGPGGIAGMNINTGELKYVVSVPFQTGHVQTNPWVSGQILFCWETGGKSPQRTWIVNSDGTGLRPLYPEASFEWVTHEGVITSDEVAFAIMGHRPVPGVSSNDIPEGTDVKGANPGQEAEWGLCGTREKPTGLGIVNINTREMTIAGQIPYGSGFWHVSGDPDGRFVVGDNFARELYLIDRKTNEMMLLTAGHKPTAADHPHPTFKPDGTEIEIQSAMLSEDGKSMNICIVSVPEEWLKRSVEEK